MGGEYVEKMPEERGRGNLKWTQSIHTSIEFVKQLKISKLGLNLSKTDDFINIEKMKHWI